MNVRRRRLSAAVIGSGLVTTAIVGLPASAAVAAAGVQNPSFESLSQGFATCWAPWGTGQSTSTAKVVGGGKFGKRAVQIKVANYKSGQKTVIQTAGCAPTVTPGKQYDLSVYYKSTAPNVAFVLFRHTKSGWKRWQTMPAVRLSKAYRKTKVRTPVVPAGTDKIRFALSVYGNGALMVDGYTQANAKGPAPCDFGVACTKGNWKVQDFGDNPNVQYAYGAADLQHKGIRSVHAVLLHNGKVLIISGSGNSQNNFKAKGARLTSWLYDPVTGKHKTIRTPIDMFCAGHVQLADGRVLVMSGTKDYPLDGVPDSWEGSEKSYIFDPRDNKYHATNDLNDGHWYPSATVLGNGDVFSVGGFSAERVNNQGAFSRVTERFSAKQQKWLAQGQIRQSGFNWSTYPSLVLMQDGRLFYTGSSVYGHPTGLAPANGPVMGPGVYDDDNNTKAPEFTPVGGLRNPLARDQSASLLLPPAQDQKIMIMGGLDFGANGGQGGHAHAQTDIIDLKKKDPKYTPGPNLPKAKTYVSAVILPDGRVMETGGSYNNRQDPVIESSIYNPKSNKFTSVVPDPVGRTYHNSALLLPDGRVLASGSNPGNETYDTRISIYSPAYLFKGPRPVIGKVKKGWAYGSQQVFKVDQRVAKATLIRPAAVTHSSDPNQRSVNLPILAQKNGAIKVKLNANENLTPPGWYMLFVSTASGIPSVATWVHVA
jgi:hypothetical protein